MSRKTEKDRNTRAGLRAPEPVEAIALSDEAVASEVTALAAQPADPTSFLSIIKAAAVSKADAETMRELLNVYKDAKADRAAEAYAEAIVQFRKMVRPIVMTGRRDDRTTKKRDGGFGTVHYSYAELTTTIEQIQPALDQCQLTPTWKMVKNDPGWVEIECIVTHILKHKESSGPVGAPPDGSGGQTAMQKRMGTITSLKRATLFMVLGLTTTEDDKGLKDAEQGDDPEPPLPPSADREAEAKRQFRDLCQQKAGAKFVKDQLLAILAGVRAASGKEDVAECLAWLDDEAILLAPDGTLSLVTDTPADDPFGEPQTSAAAEPKGLQGGADPASSYPPPPLSGPSIGEMLSWPNACDECGKRYKVLPAGGKCKARGCLGHVVPVGA